MIDLNKEAKSGKSRRRGIRYPKLTDHKSIFESQIFTIEQFEKGKIDSQAAKDKTNLLQASSTQLKRKEEEKEIRQIIEIVTEKIKNEVTLRLEKFYEVISSIVGKEQFEIIATEINRTEKETKSLITSGKKEIEENIKKRTSYQLSEKFAENPENLSVNVISAIRALSDEQFKKVLEDPKIKKQIQTLLFGHRN